jgi:NADH:ubiquinone oxidoreductase subunit E
MNDADLKERLRPIVESYSRPQAALVPMINALLDAGEGVGPGAVSVLADVCGVEVDSVVGLLGHYRSFARGPQSCDLVCFGTVCHLLGAEQVYEHLRFGEAGVDVPVGEVSPAPCLGHCYAAPALKTRDGTLYRVVLPGSGA